MKEDGCKSRQHLQRQDHVRRGPGRNIELAAKAQGLKVEGNDGTDQNAPNYRSLAAKINGRLLRRLGRDRRELRPGVQGRGAPRKPNIKLYGPGRRGRGGVHQPEEGRHPRRHRRRARRSRWRRWARGVQEAQRTPRPRSSSRTSRRSTTTRQPDPYAIYGYETMALALDTLKAVGDKANDRKAVAEQLVATRRAARACSARTTSTRTATRRLTDYGLYDDQGRAARLRQGRSRRQPATDEPAQQRIEQGRAHGPVPGLPLDSHVPTQLGIRPSIAALCSPAPRGGAAVGSSSPSTG